MPDGEGFYGPGEFPSPGESGFDWNRINQALVTGIPPLSALTGGAGAWEPPSFQWGQEPIETVQLDYAKLAKFGIVPGDSPEMMRAKIAAWEDSQPAVPPEGEAEKSITYDTISEGGWVYMVTYEDGKILDREPLGRDTETAEPTAYSQPTGAAPTDPYGRTATWVDRLGQWDYPPDWGKDPVTQEAGYTPSGTAPQWRPGELELQQQALAQEQQNYLAQIAAQPKSWLEYAAASGQPAAVQPWMLPLMPQQYPELAGLQPGQQIPGWPSQFAGTSGGIGGGAPTTGGGMPTTGAPLGGGTTGWQPQTVDEYLARGLSPSEAEEAAEYDRLHGVWRGATPGPEKALAFLNKGQYAAEKPETLDRYQQAITNVQSGQPLLGGLGTTGKFDLVEQLIRQGMDRTLAERQVFGGSRTFAPYTAISDITGAAPTTRTSREPTAQTPQESIQETAIGPYTGEFGAYEAQPVRKRVNIPGMSWHDIDIWGTNQGGSSWLDRIRQDKPQQVEGGEPLRATMAPSTTSQQSAPTSQQSHQPSAYAAGSWAGYNPNLPLGQMPALTRPSRQYQARMGPTALDQYAAYVQARTGMTPEEMQFRLWSTAPPGGGFRGLQHTR